MSDDCSPTRVLSWLPCDEEPAPLMEALSWLICCCNELICSFSALSALAVCC